MRPSGMLGLLLGCCLLLIGCGGSDTASDPTPGRPSVSTTTVPPATESEGGSASADPSVGAVESDQVAILSATATAAGGEVSTTGAELSDDAAVQSFGAQFGPRLANRVARVVARTDVPVGSTLYGAVVAIGCDVPPGVVVSTSDSGVVISAEKVTAPLQECFAPVTSVALVLVPDA